MLLLWLFVSLRVHFGRTGTFVQCGVEVGKRASWHLAGVGDIAAMLFMPLTCARPLSSAQLPFSLGEAVPCASSLLAPGALWEGAFPAGSIGSYLPAMFPVVVSTLQTCSGIVLQGFAGTASGGLPERFTSTLADTALLASSELGTRPLLPQGAWEVSLVGGSSLLPPFLPWVFSLSLEDNSCSLLLLFLPLYFSLYFITLLLILC